MNHKQYTSNTKYLNTKVYLLAVLLILSIFIIDLLTPLGVAAGVPYILVILVSLWSTKSKTTLILATVCSCMTLLGLHLSPPAGESWQVLLNRGLALFAIWVTAILAIKWKSEHEKIAILNNEILKEKEKIYTATIYSAQHITNNLLNELKTVELEISNHPTFDKEVSIMFNDMQKEANNLMKKLSAVDKIDDESIKQSVLPN